MPSLRANSAVIAMRLPPLVDPGPPLPPDEAARTARQSRLAELGEVGQRRLSAARVLVIGAGGLGAPALHYLAGAGVGVIGIVDHDVVELSNLHRQVIHGHGDLGEPKVRSAARRVRELSPHTTVRSHHTRLDESNIGPILDEYDLVLDGTDNFATRYLVADECASRGVPLVWASVLQFDAQVSVFWSRPPEPALPVVLRDVFPVPPAADGVPSCAEAGVIGALCGIVGSMMATEAIKLITGMGQVLLGRIAVVDTLTMRVHEVAISARSSRADQLAVSQREPKGQGTGVRPAALDLADYQLMRRQAEAEGRKLILLDVREPSEFAADALAGAVNVPVGVLEQHSRSSTAASAEGLLTAAGAHPESVVVAYCVAGVRAKRAVRILTESGIDSRMLAPEAVDQQRSAEQASAGSR